MFKRTGIATAMAALVIGLLTVPNLPAAFADAGSTMVDDATSGVPAGVGLQPVGSMTITQPGTHLDSLDIQGCLTILADNVWVSRVRVTCYGGSAAIRQKPPEPHTCPRLETTISSSPSGDQVGDRK